MLLLLLPAVIGCEESYEPDIRQIHPDNINLLEPRKDQRSYFLRYEGDCDSYSNVRYTGDTLLLEVIERNGALFMREKFTKGSPLYKQNASGIVYPVTVRENYLLLPDRVSSALFFFYGSDTLRTNPGNPVQLSQLGCRIRFNDELFTGNEIGRISDFHIGQVRRKDLTAVSCVPMILDVDAYLMYDEYLHLSHTVSNSDNISGWFLSGR
ncbi:MAG: hypothetical protein P8X57_06035 [Cyclobacteriaceae bacterium]